MQWITSKTISSQIIVQQYCWTLIYVALFFCCVAHFERYSLMMLVDFFVDIFLVCVYVTIGNLKLILVVFHTSFPFTNKIHRSLTSYVIQRNLVILSENEWLFCTRVFFVHVLPLWCVISIQTLIKSARNT